MPVDNRSFYITYPEHPKYKENEIVSEDPLKVIINKIEMVLFTNKGDFMGDVDFGANLPFYLWQTQVSAEFIQQTIQQQFDAYIPELEQFNTSLTVEITEGDFQDILFVNVEIDEVQVRAVFR
jgi:hypothetical protein